MAASKGNYGKIKYICSECGYNSQKWLSGRLKPSLS